MIKKLNFGSGEDIREGFDNVDIQKSPKIQKSFNFDKFPYPIKENTYDYVFSQDVFEHLEDPWKVLFELWRITKNKGIIEIRVPYYNNKGAFGSFEHKHYFSEQCFLDFVSELNVTEKKHGFEIKQLKLTPTRVGKYFPKKLREKLAIFIGGMIGEIHVKLEVKK